MSTWIPKPAPRPKRAPKKVAPRLKRSRMKQRNVKRDGASFPKVKNRAYRVFVRSHDCLLRGEILARAVSPFDRMWWNGGVKHYCFGPVDPAHVGKHQATGAGDVGQCVPLCRAAHHQYDEHRARFYRVTKLTERRLAHIAAGLALKYSEGGWGVTERIVHKEPA